MTKLLKLGSFTVADEIIVADPCYDYDKFDTVTLHNVLSGKYIATAEVEKNLIAALHISHSDFKNDILESESVGYIAVDSGQAGFFDLDFFRKNHGGEVGDLNTFYGLACAITLSPKQAGVIKKRGVVSSSGFGDGCYDVFVSRDEVGKIVAASLFFVEEEDL